MHELEELPADPSADPVELSGGRFWIVEVCDSVVDWSYTRLTSSVLTERSTTDPDRGRGTDPSPTPTLYPLQVRRRDSSPGSFRNTKPRREDRVCAPHASRA